MIGTSSKVIIDEAFAIDDRYEVILYVIEVPKIRIIRNERG